ncbi:MAG: hypothetical protein CMJ75_16535 [Planctomycetaceae bacterium]|nr:hypothetical protein [Planctomycetaceae bacterium]
MLRTYVGLILAATTGFSAASEIDGVYIETRTCAVYTGPCFANAEMGLAGKDAIMAWSIESGAQDGVDLAGLNVVVVISANQTLGFRGVNDAKQLKSLILIDDRANPLQRQALLAFARSHAGRAGKSAVRIDVAPIHMQLDFVNLKGHLQAGKVVTLKSRKTRPGECICKNEVEYYPPLAQVSQATPATAEEGEFRGRGLGRRWSTPGARSVYMGTFTY